MADPNRDQDLNVGGNQQQDEDNPKSETNEQVGDSEQSEGNQEGGAQEGGSHPKRNVDWGGGASEPGGGQR